MESKSLDNPAKDGRGEVEEDNVFIHIDLFL